MARKSFKCTVCEAEFLSGNWFGCCENIALKHNVAPKTFYSESAQNVQCLIKPQYGTNPQTGVSWSTPGKQQRFFNGQYTTTDPEEQEKLEQVLAGGGLITYEKYIDLKTTAEQKAARAMAETKEANRLLAEAKDELARKQAELEKLRESVPAEVAPLAPDAPVPSLASKRRTQPSV